MNRIARPVVFPARAGMSRNCTPQSNDELSFPRPRGDEPLAIRWGALNEVFSPPARG